MLGPHTIKLLSRHGPGYFSAFLYMGVFAVRVQLVDPLVYPTPHTKFFSKSEGGWVQEQSQL